jgi:hypothetical protein
VYAEPHERDWLAVLRNNIKTAIYPAAKPSPGPVIQGAIRNTDSSFEIFRSAMRFVRLNRSAGRQLAAMLVLRRSLPKVALLHPKSTTRTALLRPGPVQCNPRFLRKWLRQVASSLSHWGPRRRNGNQPTGSSRSGIVAGIKILPLGGKARTIQVKWGDASI